MSNNPDVTITHSDYVRMTPYWKMMEDTLQSQKHVQDLGTKYLPILDGMTQEQYEAYTKRAEFPLFTKHNLSTFVGMVMRKKVLLNNIPKDFEKNVDGAGTTLQTYVRKLVEEYLQKGRAATLVEYGNTSKRPKLLLYPAESITNWREQTIKDTKQLTLVVLKELAEKVENTFKIIEEVQYRVLTLEEYSSTEYAHVEKLPLTKDKYFFRQRVFNVKGELLFDVVPMSKFKPLDFIPIEIHGGVDVQYPPLITIAEQNLSWYRIDADYKHGLHYVALPTPYVTGVDPDDENAPIAVGPSQLWYLPDGAKAGMLEFTGEGLAAIAKAKETTFDSIITLSSRILAPPSAANETATAANIRNAGETASLAEMIGVLSTEMTRAINYALNWTDEIDEVSVGINTDFIPVILSGSDVASYVASYLKGGISFYTLFHTLKRGEIQEGNRRLEDELKDITKEQLELQATEVVLAEKLATIANEKVADPRNNEPKDKRPMGQMKEGEQFNKGQTYKEN